MLLHLVAILAVISWSASAPTDRVDCDGNVECMYKKLQADVKPTPDTKPIPCKRMLGRHGKRSAEEEECDDEEGTTTPTSAKRVFLESQISKMAKGSGVDESNKREMVVPLSDGLPSSIISPNYKKEPQSREIAIVENHPESKDSSTNQQARIESLSSQLELLKSKISQLEESKKQAITTTTPTDAQRFDYSVGKPSAQSMRQKLKAVEDDIDDILSVIPSDNPKSNLYQLQLLSQRLAAEERRREKATTTTESTELSSTASDTGSLPSLKKSLEKMAERIDKLSNVVNSLIEVDKIAYSDLKKQIDEITLKIGST